MTKPPEFAPEQVLDLSLAVYKLRLEASCKGAVERMLAEKGADVVREYASSYNALTRAYLRALRDDPTLIGRE